MSKQQSIQLKNASVYLYQLHLCSNIISSDCWLLKYKKDGGQPILVNSDSSVIIGLKKQISLIIYTEIRSYLWKVDAGVISLQFPITAPYIQLFQFQLQSEDIKIIQWKDTKEQIRDIIKAQCSNNIENHPYLEKGKIHKLGCSIGGFFGALNKLAKGVPESGIQEAIKEKAEKLKQNNINSQTKQNLKNLKEKSRSLNQTITETVKPARELIEKATDKIGTRFYGSSNFLIRGIRELGLKLKNSLNEGYRDGQTIKKKQLKADQQKMESQRGLS